ncbi:hypothetical protein BV898_19525 [Hypsibius exemplaris]|uniref:Uncharacterized protein n=1 Tax=Hypsibius exemplaris TaxID=2072580 RepID=A0A9X6NLM3_HYPEX|nr:hypothetical protein BV898_19525 [Hypsibius exemplaris]
MGTSGGGDTSGHEKSLCRAKVVRKCHDRNFLILTLLTVSVLICYGPRTILFIVTNEPARRLGGSLLASVTVLLGGCQLILDPILFTVLRWKSRPT